jgi:hypothetical protein
MNLLFGNQLELLPGLDLPLGFDRLLNNIHQGSRDKFREQLYMYIERYMCDQEESKMVVTKKKKKKMMMMMMMMMKTKKRMEVRCM